MCRNQAEGGRRCAAHSTRSPSAERTVYHARRFFGANTVENRAKLSAIPKEFMSGSAAERAAYVGETEDPVILSALQENDPAPAFAKTNLQAAILSNPNVAPDFLATRVDTRPVAKNFIIIKNPAISDATLEALVETGAPSIRSAAMTRLVEKGADLDKFAENSSPKIRSLVAAHTADIGIRNKLLNDPEIKVRERALTNENLRSQPVPLSVASDASPKVRELAARTTTDKALLRGLAADKDQAVAPVARANPVCPELAPIGDEVADITKYATLQAVAMDRNATSAQIATAYASPRATIEDREALAKNPRSSTVMKQNHFSKLGNASHQLLAMYPDTDPSLLSMAAKSKSKDVRLAVAGNENASRATLEALAASKDAAVSVTAKETLKYVAK